MKQLSSRQYLIAGIVVAICLTYIGRLFYIQIVDDKYKIMAVNNAIRRIVDYPPRGVIYDRTGKLLVANQAAYDLMVIPNQVKDCDTMELCRLINIDKQGFKDRFTKLKKQKHPWYQPAVFEGQLSGKAYAALQEKLYDFQGFYVQSRTIRNYPKNVGAHLLGYVGEVNEKIVEDSSYYQMGDYIGLSGIEKSYEVPLRGIRGVRHVEKDVFNRERAAFANGRFDTLGIAGVDLTSSIDLDLQEYGEKLMKNKIGSIVAIEPGTGEILTLVSSPTYDPNLLVGHERSKNYVVLLRDTMKPLFNRALMASYPPGSTFKIANALVGQEVGVVTPETRYSCNRGFSAGGVHVGCHAHASPVDLKFSITTSCNAYYCNVFRSIVEHYKPSEAGYRTWRDYIMSFGFGAKLPSDLPNELRGNVPSAEYYNKLYGKNRWKALSVISLGIGQGEMGVTPLQMANYCATLANRGWYYLPHAIKKVGDKPIGVYNPKFGEKHYTKVRKQYFDIVVDAMENVMVNGTGRIARIDSVRLGGKTGTAQNPHGKDHSIFICFGPVENPKIAIAVYVENAGFGATWAAPIASLMIEKYLKGKTKRPDMEKRMMEGVVLPVYEKVRRTGTPIEE